MSLRRKLELIFRDSNNYVTGTSVIISKEVIEQILELPELKNIGFEQPISERNSKKELLDKLAEQLFVALIANPERYKYIATEFEKMKLGSETNAHKILTEKNINKAYKLAEAFLNYER